MKYERSTSDVRRLIISVIWSLFLDTYVGLNEDNSTNHKGGVHLEEHHEEYSNMSNVLKSVDVPDELDWREYGKRTKHKTHQLLSSTEAPSVENKN